MPIKPTYPGVYIQEVPSGVRTIVGVATSVTAFVGFFRRGPMDRAVQILSVAEFERVLGGLDTRSEASYAIQQFFLNGGSEAWVVRVAKKGKAKAAGIDINESAATGSKTVLHVAAANAGVWGNRLRIEVDHDTTDPTKTFNLVVTEYATGTSGQPLRTETFRNLIIDSAAKGLANDAIKAVNDGSKLIRLSLVSAPAQLPGVAATGTTSKLWTAAEVASMLTSLAAADQMVVSLSSHSFSSNPVKPPTIPISPSLAWLASTLQSEIRKVDSKLEKATVSVLGGAATGAFLHFASATVAADTLAFSGNLVTKLGLVNGNVQQYSLGAKTAVGAQALPNGSQQAGNDGKPPGAAELIGSASNKKGLYALEDVDLINILCIPRTVALQDKQANQVASKATAYCEKRRSFFILDVPHAEKTRDEVAEVRQWLSQNDTLRSKNVALYYPRPLIADPLNKYRLRKVAASGTLAGLYARTDASRGVWKAPAGTDATLRGVQKLEYLLTDPENGTLNPLAINCLRSMPVYGNICWGARTLDGADQKASEWKYIPVRRLALFCEETLYRNLKWVVFEPNDEPLWAQIRLNIGAFMHNLFRQGAFQGSTPKEAYLVKCDKETTTQNDIDLGIVNIVVGFAPLKPAEFVIITIKQLAGQVQA